MDYQPEPAPRPASFQAMRRVSMPGIFLAVVGVLNLIMAVLLIVQGVQLQKLTLADFEQKFEEAQKDWNEQQKEGWKELQRQGWTFSKMQDIGVKAFLGLGVPPRSSAFSASSAASAWRRCVPTGWPSSGRS